MPSLTPRSTAVHALARREAELLRQEPRAAHVLIALIWEEGGIAAIALTAAGLAKGSEEDLRLAVASTSEPQRGRDLDTTMVAAARIADEFGHDYIGTEHQLLAITTDKALSIDPFDSHTRQAADDRVRALIDTTTTGADR